MKICSLKDEFRQPETDEKLSTIDKAKKVIHNFWVNFDDFQKNVDNFSTFHCPLTQKVRLFTVQNFKSSTFHCPLDKKVRLFTVRVRLFTVHFATFHCPELLKISTLTLFKALIGFKDSEKSNPL
ncbi:MAG: hypothetical protein J6W29_08505 [Neisseriaceae bacterium]|nr:hypothetical protein [Neisseriaceae bacterium]